MKFCSKKYHTFEGKVYLAGGFTNISKNICRLNLTIFGRYIFACENSYKIATNLVSVIWLCYFNIIEEMISVSLILF